MVKDTPWYDMQERRDNERPKKTLVRTMRKKAGEEFGRSFEQVEQDGGGRYLSKPFAFLRVQQEQIDLTYIIIVQDIMQRQILLHKHVRLTLNYKIIAANMKY